LPQSLFKSICRLRPNYSRRDEPVGAAVAFDNAETGSLGPAINPDDSHCGRAYAKASTSASSTS
jgi:hypothetical protein